jgi:hypothetical protein
MCACRAAAANFPCPRCLVPKAEFHCLLKEFPLRTTASMKQVYENARSARNKTEQERILQSHGLHLTEASKGGSGNTYINVSRRISSGPFQTQTHIVATPTMSCI